MFNDITPPQDGNERGHSIRKVSPLASQDRENRRARRAERRTVGASPVRRSRSGQPKFGKFSVWAVAGLVLIIALSILGFVFIGKTTITIVPQHEDINLSTNVVYTAYQSAEEGELSYSVLEHTIEATDSVAATGRETVEDKASGRIVVYNNHSSAPQRLIKNTRFEAPSGEIYRVRNSFVVPGQLGDGAPGTIEVTVFADKPGESQNITALGTKFTIPGLKGDPRYDTFHAELKEPITGGFIGERAIVDEDILNASRTKLRAQLNEQVSSTLIEQANETAEIFDGGVFVTFESAPVVYAENDTATVREVAHIKAVAFDKNELAKMLATAALANPEDGAILIDTPENLTMSIVNRDGVDIVNDALIQFTLQGHTTLTWQIDSESLKQDLVGKHSGALNTVMSGYPGIKSAQATIRPFWKNEFPSETGGITIETISEE